MHTFKIPKMSCGGCATRITNAIRQIDSDAQVNIDIATKTVQVRGSIDEDRLREAMTKAGYSPDKS